MNARHMFMALVATTCAALGSSSAWGNQLAGEVITGPVMSVSGQSITIQGHSYPITAGSAAAAAAPRLTPGQLVDVQLDGPASSASSHAVSIVPHTGP